MLFMVNVLYLLSKPNSCWCDGMLLCLFSNWLQLQPLSFATCGFCPCFWPVGDFPSFQAATRITQFGELEDLQEAVQWAMTESFHIKNKCYTGDTIWTGSEDRDLQAYLLPWPVYLNHQHLYEKYWFGGAISGDFLVRFLMPYIRLHN